MFCYNSCSVEETEKHPQAVLDALQFYNESIKKKDEPGEKYMESVIEEPDVEDEEFVADKHVLEEEPSAGK